MKIRVSPYRQSTGNYINYENSSSSAMPTVLSSSSSDPQSESERSRLPLKNLPKASPRLIYVQEE